MRVAAIEGRPAGPRGARAAAPRRAGVVRLCIALAGLALGGCSTVGVHTSHRDRIDFGEPATMRVCVLKTDDIPEERALALIEHVRRELVPYGIAVEVPWMRAWKRPGFMAPAIMGVLLRRPLEPPCDRLLGLVDRHFGDFVWGIFMPEVFGAVETATATRGFVVASYGSVNQVGAAPEAVVVHEVYHLLGCPHGASLKKCYARIAALKAAIDANADFFPGVAGHAHFLTTRDAADAALAAAREEAAREQACATSRRSRDSGGCARD